jgi:hypothetical protein
MHIYECTLDFHASTCSHSVGKFAEFDEGTLFVFVVLQGRLYSCQDLQGNLLHSEYVLPEGQFITRQWCEDTAAQVTTSAYHSAINVTVPAYTIERR